MSILPHHFRSILLSCLLAVGAVRGVRDRKGTLDAVPFLLGEVGARCGHHVVAGSSRRPPRGRLPAAFPGDVASRRRLDLLRRSSFRFGSCVVHWLKVGLGLEPRLRLSIWRTYFRECGVYS